MIEYHDFLIQLEPRRGDAYPIDVRSPAGEARALFVPPFDPHGLGELRFEMGNRVRGTRGAEAAAPGPGNPQEIGDALFRALFQGATRSLFDQSLGMLHGSGRGLRIKLRFDPTDPSVAALASLPWEYLYRRETRDFLNLSRETPVVRYLDVQRPYAPIGLAPPLRLLVVIADPVDWTGLDLARERARIEESLAPLPEVEVDFLPRATIFELQNRLAEQPYHALHYMGHGDFDTVTGQGMLIFEDEAGRGIPVHGGALGRLLRDVWTLRLVFLNACNTGRITRVAGHDPFAGVASALVLARIPAVVAMQFPLSDEAAIVFSRVFYQRIARGFPVDAAVAEGRKAIDLALAGTLEWGTPVLYMRAPDGVLFSPGAHTPAPPIERTPPPMPVIEPEIEREIEPEPEVEPPPEPELDTAPERAVPPIVRAPGPEPHVEPTPAETPPGGLRGRAGIIGVFLVLGALLAVALLAQRPTTDEPPPEAGGRACADLESCQILAEQAQDAGDFPRAYALLDEVVTYLDQAREAGDIDEQQYFELAGNALCNKGGLNLMVGDPHSALVDFKECRDFGQLIEDTKASEGVLIWANSGIEESEAAIAEQDE